MVKKMANQVQSAFYKRLMFLLATTQLLLIVDASIVNVIVPTIARELSFSETGQSWIVNAYLTVFGGTLLVSGRIADLMGRTRVFQLGLLVLAIGSAVCALAHSSELLIVGRAAQGLGSAFAAAASLALILASFKGEQRYKALGLLAAMGGLGGALGTFLGGALTEWFGWRSTFWLSVVIPLGLLMLSPAIFLNLVDDQRRGKVDALGAALLMIGQSLLAFGIISFGESARLSDWVWIAGITCSFLILIIFGLWQRKAPVPLIAPQTWRNIGLMEALVYSGVGQLIIFPMFFVGNLYLQNTLKFSPMASGASFLPLCGVVILTATNAPSWLRFGEIKALAAGFVLLTMGMLWLSQAKVDGNFLTDVLGPTLLVGASLPIIAISSNILGAKNASTGQEGLVSGLLNTFQQFGAVIGLAAMVSLASFYSEKLKNDPDSRAELTLLGGYQAAFLMGAIIALIAALVLIARSLRKPG